MSDTDWSKKTVLQLKGALTKRKLATDGSKEDLVQRILQYERDQLKSHDIPMEEESDAPVCKSHLTRRKIKDGYEANIALKTVIIASFQVEYVNDDKLATWLNTCQTYEIKKNLKADIIAELKFDNIELGVAAFTAMQVEFPDLEITRPKLSALEYCNAAAQDRTWWSRLVVLEGLSPAINTEEKLKEYFPEAEKVIPFVFEPSLSEYGVLEFATIDAAREYVDCVGGEPIELEEVNVKISMCTTYLRNVPQDDDDENMKAQLTEIESNKNVMDDNARTDLYNEVVELKGHVSELSRLDMAEMNSMKQINYSLKQLYKVNDNFRLKKAQLVKDTELRKARGDMKMPEPTDGDDELCSDNLEVANIEKELEGLNIQLEEARREERVIRGLILKCKEKLPPHEKNRHLLKGAAGSSSETTGEDGKDTQGCMIHISNLPEHMPIGLRKSLKDMFEKFGVVDRLFTLGKTATVTMLSEEDAKEAIEELEGKMFEGKAMKLSLTQAKLDHLTKKCEVFITNLPYKVEGNKNMELTKMFMEIGPVVKVYAQNFETHAFVTMSNEEDAATAVKQINGKMYRGKIMGVFERTEKKNDSGGKRKKGYENNSNYNYQNKGFPWQQGAKKWKSDHTDPSLAMIQDLSNNLNEKMRKLETMHQAQYPIPRVGNHGPPGPPRPQGPPMHGSHGPPMPNFNQFPPPGQQQGGYFQKF